MKKPKTKDIHLPYFGDSEFAVMNIAREMYGRGLVDGNQVAAIAPNAFVASWGLGTYETIYVEISPDVARGAGRWVNAEDGLGDPELTKDVLESVIYCMQCVFENANTGVGFWTSLERHEKP